MSTRYKIKMMIMNEKVFLIRGHILSLIKNLENE